MPPPSRVSSDVEYRMEMFEMLLTFVVYLFKKQPRRRCGVSCWLFRLRCEKALYVFMAKFAPSNFRGNANDAASKLPHKMGADDADENEISCLLHLYRIN